MRSIRTRDQRRATLKVASRLRQSHGLTAPQRIRFDLQPELALKAVEFDRDALTRSFKAHAAAQLPRNPQSARGPAFGARSDQRQSSRSRPHSAVINERVCRVYSFVWIAPSSTAVRVSALNRNCQLTHGRQFTSGGEVPVAECVDQRVTGSFYLEQLSDGYRIA